MVETRLSIGLPVYNGENFLEETLQSLVAQSFADFELVISDNASTDRTQEICETYAGKDPRIKYFRQQTNLGASANYNFVFQNSSGKYFKWTAHDDLYAPSFLERCVEVLDSRSDVVLVFPLGKEIDDQGNVTRLYPSRGPVNTMSKFQRFHNTVLGRQPFVPVFGVVRRETLAQTRLIGKYAASDIPLIGELSLRGNLYEVPEYLFFYRVHPSQSWGGNKSKREIETWFDPRRKTKRTYPTWRLLLEHERTLWRIPLGVYERVKLHVVIAWWMRKQWRLLIADFSE